MFIMKTVNKNYTLKYYCNEYLELPYLGLWGDTSALFQHVEDK